MRAYARCCGFNCNYEDNTVLNIKPIKDFDGLYFISDCGKVFNQDKRLKTYFTKTGYECVKLYKNKIKYSKTVHRLVAENFIPNPLNKAEVNHINGNKSDNSINNLKWNTSSENKQHAKKTGLNPYNYPTKGKKLGKSSNFRYVAFDEIRNKWRSALRVNGKNFKQKRFNSERETAEYVNYLIDTYNLDKPKNVFN